MKESDEKARLVVAAEGLRCLMGVFNGGPITRTQLFPPPEGKESDATLRKAGRAKGWQKSYLDRMCELEILVKIQQGSSEMFKVNEEGGEGAVLAILKDWMDDHGVLLSKLVFGGLSTEGFTRLFADRSVQMVNQMRSEVDQLRGDDAPPVTVEDFRSPSFVGEQLADPGEDQDLPLSLEGFTALFERLFARLDTLDRGFGALTLASQRQAKASERETKASAEVVSTAQGLMRKQQEPPPADRTEEQLEATTRLSTQFTTLIEAVDNLAKGVTNMNDKLVGLDERLQVADADKLGKAIRTAEVALEVLADAAGESQPPRPGQTPPLKMPDQTPPPAPVTHPYKPPAGRKT